MRITQNSNFNTSDSAIIFHHEQILHPTTLLNRPPTGTYCSHGLRASFVFPLTRKKPTPDDLDGA